MLDRLSQFKISLRVNNQVTITRQAVTPKRTNRYENFETNSLSQNGINSLIERYAAQEGLATSKRWYDPKRRIVPYVGANADIKQNPLYLDLIDKFQQDDSSDRKNHHKEKKKGYGQKPTIKNFSVKAGQKLRECGAAIDILCNGSPQKCRVVTLTLPSSGIAAYQSISNWSGYATNRLLQVIRRKKDDRFYWFYCVEHQKRGALHWHICLYHVDPAQSERAGAELVSKWHDILGDISRRCNLDLLYSKGFGRSVKTGEMQCPNQQMRQGCGNYFSKYASKTATPRDSKTIEDCNTRNARLYPPSSFWGRSHNLVKLCKDNSLSYKFEGMDGTESESLRGEAFEILSQFNIVLNHSFSFKKEIELKGNGRLTICEGESEVFYVSPEDYQHLLAHFRFLYSDRPSCAIDERAKRRGGSNQALVTGDF